MAWNSFQRTALDLWEVDIRAWQFDHVKPLAGQVDTSIVYFILVYTIVMLSELMLE